MRSSWPLAVAVVTSLILGGCSDDDPDPAPAPDTPVAEPTVSVEDAPTTYRPIVGAVADAVGGVAGPGRPTDDPEVVFYDAERESCVFASLRYEFDAVFGEETSWDEVRAAVEQALGPEGFELTDQLDIPGGFNGFDATTEDGVVVEVRSKLGDASTLELDAPVRGGCDRENPETVPPAAG